MSRNRSPKTAQAFVLALGQALHRYGAPAHRVEAEMEGASSALGVDGQFFVTPTSIMSSFGRGSAQRTSFARVGPGDVDLDKLTEVEDVARAVMEDHASPPQGTARLAALVDAPARYGPWITAVAFGVASTAAALLMGAGGSALVAAALAGLASGVLAIFTPRHPHTARTFALFTAFIATVFASFIAGGAGPAAVGVATLAGVIVALPGLSVTVAMTELATQNLQSGSARLAGAMSVFLELGLGVALGKAVAKALPGPLAPIDLGPTPELAPYLALAAAGLAFTVLFRARPRDLWAVAAAGALGYGVSRLGAGELGPELGACLGAVAVGVAGNVYAHLLDRPAAVMHMPGLVLLVPGSVGFRGLAYLLDGQAVPAMESLFEMALIAGALAAGFLLANVWVPPRRAHRPRGARPIVQPA